MNGQGKLLTHYLKNADKLIIPVIRETTTGERNTAGNCIRILFAPFVIENVGISLEELSLLAILWGAALITS